MNDFDLPGMGDYEPPDPDIEHPCAHCDEERDLPPGVDLFIGQARVCYLCLRDHLDDNDTPSGRDYITEEILDEFVVDLPADQDAQIYRPPFGKEPPNIRGWLPFVLTSKARKRYLKKK